MTPDMEISKKLALAIGWIPRRVGQDASNMYVNVSTDYVWHNDWKIFDYRDWNVIGPIAERYNKFPKQFYRQWAVDGQSNTLAETPQRTIAMAVIQGVRK